MIELMEDDDTAVIEPAEQAAKPSAIALAFTGLSGQVAALDALESTFVDIETKYANVVYDVTTTKGMTDAKAARAEVRQVRFDIQNAEKETNRQIAAAKSSFTLANEGRIARVLLIEAPLDAQIKVEEDRKALEKAAREQAEREANAVIDRLFSQLALNTALAGKGSYTIQEEIRRIKQVEVSLELFGPRAGEASVLKAATMEQLSEMFDAATTMEITRDLLEKQRLEMAETIAKQKVEMAADRAQLDADIKQAADERAKEDARRQKIRDDLDAELTAKRQAAEAADNAARKAAQAIVDEAARVTREAAEAERQRLDDEALATRQENDKAARDKLLEEGRLAAEKLQQEIATAAAAAQAKELADAKLAQLHRAAPALLSALRDCLAFIEKDLAGSNSLSERAVARSAIQLATGE